MNSRHDEALWSNHKTNRQLSARRQIDAAIDHMNAGSLECAVTLALAAEGQLLSSKASYLFNALKARVPNEEMPKFNILRNWLKHHDQNQHDEIEFYDFEVGIALIRATSKFFATYGQSSEKMEAFVVWCRSKQLLDDSNNER